MTDTRIGIVPAGRRQGSFMAALRTQLRVIGALIMREIHTRYGRENIGYLWLIIEPLIFGTAISIMHGVRGGTVERGGINPVALGITGYCIFIIFRGIVGRADGALRGNQPLLHHRMVTIFDVCISRCILELVGCFCAFLILMTAANILGLMRPPERPLYMLMGIGYVWWFSTALGLIITAGSYERPMVERLIHPATYFSMPLSGAFFRVVWLPQPYKSYVSWIPTVHMFETVRYGVFETCTLDYVDFRYMTLTCMVLTLIGLLQVRRVKGRISG